MAATMVEAEVHDKSPETAKKVPPEKDPDTEKDTTKVKEAKEGDSTKFEFKICQKRFAKAAGAKNHIKLVHVKNDLENPSQNPFKKKRKPEKCYSFKMKMPRNISWKKKKTTMKNFSRKFMKSGTN